MKKIVLLIIFCPVFFAASVFAQEDVKVRFAVLALDTELETRVLFEDALVSKLQENRFDAVASHQVLPEFEDVRNPDLRLTLLENGINVVFILRPIDVGEDASLESMSEHVSPESYNTIKGFVQSYRGDNLSSDVVVQVAVFIFNENTSMNFWQGMIWLDDHVENQEQGIAKLVDLVIFNANQQRPLMRERLGLPPLTD